MKQIKVAFSALKNRVAPVFDTSSEIIVTTVEDSKIVSEESVCLTQNTVFELIDKLHELKINQLVCGGISRALQYQIEQKDIIVVPFISGELSAVKEGWLKNELNKEEYIMPGCCGRRVRGGSMKAGAGRMNANGRNDCVAGKGIGRGAFRGCGLGFGPGAATGFGIGQGRGQGRGLGLGRGFGLGANVNQNNLDS